MGEKRRQRREIGRVSQQLLDKAWREIEFGRTNHGRVLTDEKEKDWERQKRHRETAVSR